MIRNRNNKTCCPLDKFIACKGRDKIKLAKDFIKFLCLHDLYGKFVLNYARAENSWKKECHIEGSTPNQYILRAFSWADSPEGHNYWSKFNELWRCKVRLWGGE